MISAAALKSDVRRARGQETRQRLMHAATLVIADKGFEGLSVKAVLDHAQQNNSSALHYHFGNMQGLLAAIHAERSEQTRAKRGEMLDALLATTKQPEMHQLCALFVRPQFELARARADYCLYLKAFAHHLIRTDASVVAKVAQHGGGGESGRLYGRLLRRALPHLSDKLYAQRLEFAVRLCASSLHGQACGAKPFRGQQSEFFLQGLIDALQGLLVAPVTASSEKRMRKRKP